MAKAWSIPTLIATAGLAGLSAWCFYTASGIPSVKNMDSMSSAASVIYNYDPALPLAGAFTYADTALAELAAKNPYYVGSIEEIQEEMAGIGARVGNIAVEDFNTAVLDNYLYPRLRSVASIDNRREGLLWGGAGSVAGALGMLWLSIAILREDI